MYLGENNIVTSTFSNYININTEQDGGVMYAYSSNNNITFYNNEFQIINCYYNFFYLALNNLIQISNSNFKKFNFTY